jgi:hypothetical protein
MKTMANRVSVFIATPTELELLSVLPAGLDIQLILGNIIPFDQEILENVTALGTSAGGVVPCQRFSPAPFPFDFAFTYSPPPVGIVTLIVQSWKIGWESGIDLRHVIMPDGAAMAKADKRDDGKAAKTCTISTPTSGSSVTGTITSLGFCPAGATNLAGTISLTGGAVISNGVFISPPSPFNWACQFDLNNPANPITNANVTETISGTLNGVHFQCQVSFFWTYP